MNVSAKPHSPGPSAEPYATTPAPATVRIERLLPGPVERVWTYLTDSGKRAKWFAAGPMELRERGAVTLTFRNAELSGGQKNPNSSCSPDGDDHVMHGVITRCEPPHLLAFNWNADGSGSEAVFELSQEGPDTRLVVTHHRLADRRQLLSVSAGWHVHLGILLDLLQESPPRRFWPEHTRLEKVYAERLGEQGPDASR
jgi:uncharacterized protein YndB with AHSA1/START domain